MKILRFQASNFLRLSAVEIAPDSDGLVIISGRNGQGKTSVMKAIWAALGGKDAAPDDPIHDGEKEARITLDLGEMTVSRRFSRDEATGEVTTELVVKRADGSKITKTPQAMLNTLWDRLAVDPLAFAHAKPAEQFETLKSFVTGFDFDANVADRKVAFDTRTAVKRDAKALRARVGAIVLPAKKPVVEDMTAVIAAQQEAFKHNEDIAERRRNREQGEATVRELDRQIDDLEEALETATARRAGLKKRLAEAPPLPELIDLSEFSERIRASQQNEHVLRSYEERDRLVKEADALDLREEDLTDEIAQLDTAKADAIAKSKLPVKGLDLVDGAVLLNGHPFANASTAEQLRASIAIAGAMAPELRVLRVAEGSMLDKAGLALVEQYARENDLQIWMEVVSDSGDVGFVIEDGELAQ